MDSCLDVGGYHLDGLGSAVTRPAWSLKGKRLVLKHWVVIVSRAYNDKGGERWRWTLYRCPLGPEKRSALHSMGRAKTRARAREAVEKLLNVYQPGWRKTG